MLTKLTQIQISLLSHNQKFVATALIIALAILATTMPDMVVEAGPSGGSAACGGC